MLSYAIISTVIVSIISLVGILFISMNQKRLNSIIILLIALAAGTLIGDSFFHLIPEALENIESIITFLLVILGFAVFFFIENFLFWHHHHDPDCEIHSFSYLNLIGDGIHNFVDGVLIALSYLISPIIGFTTTIAVIAHEIPQEIGDYAVLIHGGFTRSKALFYNFLSALTAILGAVLGYFLISESFINYLVPIMAGMFLYIGATDLVPELGREKSKFKAYLSFVFFLIGIALMYSLLFLE
ncbi:ZIP family metal transporter [Candidatus Pacearchaeota archaeon]|nr:ZIP family metal transporter [Candidatus Pacearchaeota archaeon]